MLFFVSWFLDHTCRHLGLTPDYPSGITLVQVQGAVCGGLAELCDFQPHNHISNSPHCMFSPTVAWKKRSKLHSQFCNLCSGLGWFVGRKKVLIWLENYCTPDRTFLLSLSLTVVLKTQTFLLLALWLVSLLFFLQTSDGFKTPSVVVGL